MDNQKTAIQAAPLQTDITQSVMPRSVAADPMPAWESTVILALGVWFSIVGLLVNQPHLWIPALIVLGVSIYNTKRNAGAMMVEAGLLAVATVAAGGIVGMVISLL